MKKEGHKIKLHVYVSNDLMYKCALKAMRDRARFHISEGDKVEVVIPPEAGAKTFKQNKHKGVVIDEPYKYDNGYNGNWKVPVKLDDGTTKDVPINRVKKLNV